LFPARCFFSMVNNLSTDYRVKVFFLL
jgi:hypothetical protein